MDRGKEHKIFCHSLVQRIGAEKTSGFRNKRYLEFLGTAQGGRHMGGHVE